MTRLALLTVAVCAVARAAPPAPQFYQQQQIQQINPLDYYLDHQEVTNFYNQGQQKQAGIPNEGSNSAPARLETLEPDSEVELIPGAQQPQPPQQTPVSPNLPGLLPGQRVFIVHMPVPGIRPGTIGGYQPVYIVAAAPQGNSYATNGFQNTILIDPSGQVVPQGAFQRPLLYGAPLSYRPLYQDPNAYQGQAGVVQGRASPITSSVPNSDSKSNIDGEKERENLAIKQNLEEPRRNSRPTSRSQA